MPDRDEPFDRRLEQALLAALAEIAAGAGHELNNPLAIISGRAQLLLQAESDPERRRDLATIHAQAVRAHEMIADLMLFARPPAPRRATIDVRTWLPAVLAQVRPRAQQQATKLTLSLPTAPVSFAGDPDQLAVAVRALLDNALEAVGAGGHVKLALRCISPNDDPPGGAVAISVADDGPGIPPEVLPHLFTPFYSGRSSGRGLGMGLAKCWRIVAQHGGDIEVASEPGVRTQFTIRLAGPTGS
jgi:signal transduction histidine kinase